MGPLRRAKTIGGWNIHTIIYAYNLQLIIYTYVTIIYYLILCRDILYVTICVPVKQNMNSFWCHMDHSSSPPILIYNLTPWRHIPANFQENEKQTNNRSNNRNPWGSVQSHHSQCHPVSANNQLTPGRMGFKTRGNEPAELSCARQHLAFSQGKRPCKTKSSWMWSGPS